MMLLMMMMMMMAADGQQHHQLGDFKNASRPNDPRRIITAANSCCPNLLYAYVQEARAGRGARRQKLDA